MRERVLHRASGPARLPVAITPLPVAFPRRNNRFHSPSFGPDENLVRVAAPVRQKSFRRKSVNRSNCPSAIRCHALCDKSPDRHAMRIRSQMRDFVLSPPLRGSCPGCLLSRPPHVGEPRNDRRRPSAMRGPARQSEFQAAAPTPLSRQRVKRQRVSLQPPVSGGLATERPRA